MAEFNFNASTGRSDDRINRDVMLLAIDNIGLVGCGNSNGLFILLESDKSLIKVAAADIGRQAAESFERFLLLLPFNECFCL